MIVEISLILGMWLTATVMCLSKPVSVWFYIPALCFGLAGQAFYLKTQSLWWAAGVVVFTIVAGLVTSAFWPGWWWPNSRADREFARGLREFNRQVRRASKKRAAW